MRRILLCAFLVIGTSTSLHAADWPQFRGPGGLGISSETAVPTAWSDTKNVVWKINLPGPGSSSPVVVGDKIFLTCYTGPTKGNADPASLKRYLLCFSRDGKLLWNKTITAKAKDYPYQSFQALHGFASSTPASDGKRVFVFCGVAGALAFDMDGNQLWQQSVGTRTSDWGSGASPVLFDDLVIVNAAVESGEIVALKQADGSRAWSQKAGASRAWSTPLLVNVGGSTELVASSQGRLVGIDPKKGNILWTCGGVNDYVCPSVVADPSGVVYAIGGRQNTAIAVKAGGKGTVMPLWEASKGSNVSSPLYHDGHIYWAHDGRGIAYCLDAKTGNVVYEKKLAPGSDRIYASATLAGGNIYYVSRTSGTYVVEANPNFKQVAHNTFASDRSVFNASPAIVDGRIYLRSDQTLYCIGTK